VAFGVLLYVVECMAKSAVQISDIIAVVTGFVADKAGNAWR
jgi:hypothetical protein